MERLEFGSGSRYYALEAAIHLARYGIVKDLCRGRRVLDIACGNGYGSKLMADWGAKFVDGVDSAHDAIAKAKESFAAPNIQYLQGLAEDVLTVVGKTKYDLIVSLETIEHVDDPVAFLKNLKELSDEHTSIVLSCPNDHWYYATGGGNRFHKRRYTFEEFRELTTSILGPARSWSLGTLALGFTVINTQGTLQTGSFEDPQELMLQYQELENGVLVPMQVESAPSVLDSAFYVGVWGPYSVGNSVLCSYPVSMDLSRDIVFPLNSWPGSSVDVENSGIVPDTTGNIEVRLNTEIRRLQQISRALVELLDADVSNSRYQDVKVMGEVAATDDTCQHLFRQNGQPGDNAFNKEGDGNTADLEGDNYRLQRELEKVGLQYRAVCSQLELSWNLIHQLERNINNKEEVLATVPWRVVGIWRKVRPLIPNFLVRSLKKL